MDFTSSGSQQKGGVYIWGAWQLWVPLMKTEHGNGRSFWSVSPSRVCWDVGSRIFLRSGGTAMPAPSASLGVLGACGKCADRAPLPAPQPGLPLLGGCGQRFLPFNLFYHPNEKKRKRKRFLEKKLEGNF